MQFLFLVLCVSVTLALFFLFFTLGITLEKKLQKYIFNILRLTAIIFLVIIAISITNLGFVHLLLFILSGLCILIAAIFIPDRKITPNINVNDISIVVISLIGFIASGVVLLNLNFATLSNVIPEKEKVIVLDDFTQEKDSDKNIVIIQLSEHDNKTKSYIIQTCDHDANLNFFIEHINYEIVNTEKNKIVITLTEYTDIDLLSYFKILKPNIYETKEYILYVNQDSIMYN